MDFIEELKKNVANTPQSEVADILERAFTEGKADWFVSTALAAAPQAMIGIGLEVGLRMARLDADVASKYLDKAQAGVDGLQQQTNVEVEHPLATERIARALVKIVKEMD